MLPALPPIKPLPEDVCKQIQSSVQITVLPDVVEELFKNSLDAKAHNVEIIVNFAKGFCTVKDDGEGISVIEFNAEGNLGQTNCTSRFCSPHIYGRHGQFLAHLASLSIVTISSLCGGQSSYKTMLLSPKVAPKLLHIESDLSRQGTHVTVHNLFGNLPVRFKHLALRYSTLYEEEKEFEALKRRLVAYVLSSGKPVNVRLGNASRLKYSHRSTGALPSAFSLPRIESIFRQAGFSTAHTRPWMSASATAGGVSIRAAISMTPSPSKSSQFFSWERVPIPNAAVGSLFYDAVNEAFEASQFGAAEVMADKAARPATRVVREYRQSRLRVKSGKGIDRWPQFYIRIDDKGDTLQQDIISQTAVNIPTALQNVLGLLRALLHHFLRGQNLRPKSRHVCRAHTPGPELQPRPSGADAFRSWKKLKRSHASEEETNHDLPFIGKAVPSNEELLHFDDARLLLDDIENDLEASKLQPHPLGCTSILEGNIQNPERTATWTDSSSGRSVTLDLLNGFVLLPSTIRHAPAEANPRPLRLRQQVACPKICKRLKKWPTPAFSFHKERSINTLTIHDGPPSAKTTTRLSNHRISKNSLVNAAVLTQVDGKFILSVAPTTEGPALLLVDQHAADERVHVEELYHRLCSGKAMPLKVGVQFEISLEEALRFDVHQQRFSSWAILYQVDKQPHRRDCIVTVTHLPTIIAERCSIEPKLLINLLRKGIWSPSCERTHVAGSDNSWIAKMSSCPEGLVEMINSRACRKAIMFNDILTKEQCIMLMHRLSNCTLPFQCAHGRPSMTMLTSLEDLEIGNESIPEFGHAFQAWCS